MIFNLKGKVSNLAFHLKLMYEKNNIVYFVTGRANVVDKCSLHNNDRLGSINCVWVWLFSW